MTRELKEAARRMRRRCLSRDCPFPDTSFCPFDVRDCRIVTGSQWETYMRTQALNDHVIFERQFGKKTPLGGGIE